MSHDPPSFDRTIAQLYRYGLGVSVLLLLVGTTRMVAQSATAPDAQALNNLRHGEVINNVGALADGLAHFRGSAIVVLGLLTLIAVPFFRVLLSVIEFSRRRDWIYAAISLFVLVLLALSMRH